MTITQISKIQLRRGSQSDLPGAPTTLNPITFGVGLDTAEMGFSTDTQRLFIGVDPAIGSLNYRRTSFPYQNVEILTETSSALQSIVQSQSKIYGPAGFNTAILPAAMSTWTTMQYDSFVGTTYLNIEGTILALVMDYFAYTSTGTPVKVGQIRAIHQGGSAEIITVDDAVQPRRLDQTGANAYDPSLTSDTLVFQIVAANDGGQPVYNIQFQNLTSTDFKLYFKITSPSNTNFI